MRNQFPELLPESNLRTHADVLPYRWRCSECAQRFETVYLPLGADDPQYVAALGYILSDFSEHCKQQHATWDTSSAA
ncbi:MAG: hypothetical protein ABIP12_07040 [Terriglobales bacterium]